MREKRQRGHKRELMPSRDLTMGPRSRTLDLRAYQLRHGGVLGTCHAAVCYLSAVVFSSAEAGDLDWSGL